jgi:hypothetical protein
MLSASTVHKQHSTDRRSDERERETKNHALKWKVVVTLHRVPSFR